MADPGHTFGRPSRNDLVSVIGEMYSERGWWRQVTKALSPPCREWLADAVDEYFAEDPVTVADVEVPVVRADRWWRPKPSPETAPEPARTPCPDGFKWIGQPFYSCDECGLPAWVHAGMATFPRGPFAVGPGTAACEPWAPGQAEACRAKWEPALRARQAEMARG